jgi:hypothetical protein
MPPEGKSTARWLFLAARIFHKKQRTSFEGIFTCLEFMNSLESPRRGSLAAEKIRFVFMLSKVVPVSALYIRRNYIKQNELVKRAGPANFDLNYYHFH